MIEKKLFTFISILAISFMLFSCASTPEAKEENKVEQAVSEEETPKDDLIDLQEAVTQEELSELPEIALADEQTSQNEETISEPEEISYEPVIQEEQNTVLLNEKDEIIKEQEEEKERLEKEIARLTSELEQVTKANEEQENSSTDSKQTDVIQDNQNETALIQTEESETDVNSSEESSIIEDDEKDYRIKTEEIKPSRTVTMQKNQFIDITYPGKGWIYQGNIDSDGNLDIKNKNFIFGGRKLGGQDQSFTLRSRLAGKFLLHFYKNDTLTGNYIDDYLEVIVQDKNSNNDAHITAPVYAEIVPPKAKITAETVKAQKEQKQKELEQKKTEEAASPVKKIAERNISTENNHQKDEKESNAKTVIQTSSGQQAEKTEKSNLEPKETQETADSSKSQVSKEISTKDNENLSSDELLSKAQLQYNNKNYADALKSITDFFDKSATRIDEGLFLQGQILEEKSPVQNIKDAIESYDLVVKNYPASKLWDKANKRSIFLKRFYINIR